MCVGTKVEELVDLQSKKSRTKTIDKKRISFHVTYIIFHFLAVVCMLNHVTHMQTGS